MRIAAALMLSLLTLTAAAVAAESAKPTDPKDRKILEAFLKHTREVPTKRITAEGCRKQVAEEAEGVTWKIAPFLSMPLTAYEATGDPKYLELFVEAFENLRSALTKGEDGYLGWYGKALGNFKDPDDPDKKVDVIITSFRIVDTLSRFLEDLAREPELAEKYAGKRQEYLDLMTDHLVAKWDARGRYVDLGETGGIYRTHAGLKDVKASLTQPHNKHSIIIRALLGLHRVTGDDAYMRRAIKLGTRFKHCLTLKDGHYEWNYWDPAGAWDRDPNEPAKWKHWIGPEHKGGYYSSSLSQAVALYQHGVVFDKTDLERFLKTQLEMTWNGSMDDPKWARVDGTSPERYTRGTYMCAALAPYSEKVYEFLYTGSRQEDRVENADHAWQGGPVANGWVHGKLVAVPEVRETPQPHIDVGRAFFRKVANQGFARRLNFEVSGTGYSAPQRPAAMKPMPHADKAGK